MIRVREIVRIILCIVGLNPIDYLKGSIFRNRLRKDYLFGLAWDGLILVCIRGTIKSDSTLCIGQIMWVWAFLNPRIVHTEVDDKLRFPRIYISLWLDETSAISVYYETL
jgi:hypothetical protein